MQRISELEKKYVLEALENEFQTSKNGVFNKRLEDKFAEMFQSEFAIGHVNGTATMHAALAGLGVQPGDEVIVPPLTMSATSLAVLQNGSIPVFADVEKDTFNISPESVARVVTDKTRAVISVALYGLSPDYDPLLKVCKKHNLALIEDNAQCFLGTYKGKLVGTFGDCASYSFQASKHLTCGEGGMLTVNRETLADNVRRFGCLGYGNVDAKTQKISRDDIQDPGFNRHVSLGFNYRMSELQAAGALGQLERAEELVDQRIKAAGILDQALEGCEFFEKQSSTFEARNTYWAYSLILKTEKPETDWYRFRDAFKAAGGDGFYGAWKLSYNESYFQDDVQNFSGVHQTYNAELCPNAEYLQKRMLQFKTNYWDLSEAEQQAKILKKVIAEFRPEN